MVMIKKKKNNEKREAHKQTDGQTDRQRFFTVVTIELMRGHARFSLTCHRFESMHVQPVTNQAHLIKTQSHYNVAQVDRDDVNAGEFYSLVIVWGARECIRSDITVLIDWAYFCCCYYYF